MKIVLATSNKGKLSDFKTVLEPLGIQVLLPSEIGINMDMPEETGKTYEENAEIKAKAIYDICGLACVADDSGLEVEALDGAPGIYSARYAGEGASDKDKIDLILNELKGVAADKRKAKFVSCMCCIMSDGQKFFVKAECEGKIALAPRGNNGFGYCPIFESELGKTFAELTDLERSKINHRGKSLRKLYLELESRLKLGDYK